MTMQLGNVVPFGRSRDEYEKMFSLTENDLKKRLLGVGDGPASFNAEMTAAGHSVISIDPLYVFNIDTIRQQFESVVDNIIDQVKATQAHWVWTYHRSPERLKENRIHTFRTFAADYKRGKVAGRYVAGELPQLPFADSQFELALCSHLLFLYSDLLSFEFHYKATMEMLRVATEVRLYPLLNLTLARSPYVEPLLADLEADGHDVQVERVNYEFQKGGTEMLRICRKKAFSPN